MPGWERMAMDRLGSEEVPLEARDGKGSDPSEVRGRLGGWIRVPKGGRAQDLLNCPTGNLLRRDRFGPGANGPLSPLHWWGPPSGLPGGLHIEDIARRFFRHLLRNDARNLYRSSLGSMIHPF